MARPKMTEEQRQARLEKLIYKNNEHNKLAFLRRLKKNKGLMMQSACEIHISYRNIVQWRKDDPKFDQDVADVLRECAEYVESKLIENCAAGNEKAIEFYLVSKYPNEWGGKKQVEIQQKGVMDVAVELQKIKEQLAKDDDGAEPEQ